MDRAVLVGDFKGREQGGLRHAWSLVRQTGNLAAGFPFFVELASERVWAASQESERWA